MIMEHLKKIPLFSGLHEEQLDKIKSVCREICHNKGDFIIYQGDTCNGLFIMLSGKVRVFLSNEEGREIILEDLKDGDFFGELSLLDEQPRSATVKALSDVRLMTLNRLDFMKTLNINPGMSIKILSVMGQRLRKADEMLTTLAFMDVCGRVSKLLIDRANDKGDELPDGCIKIESPTHQSIADQIGASREAVTKAMKSLSVQRIIAVDGREITIDPQQFEIF